jgi:HlyD family secretion protein
MDSPLRRIIAWSALALAVLGAIGWSFWPAPIPVDVAVVSQGPFKVTVLDFGRTRVRDAYVVSAPVTGRLLRIGNIAGQDVVAGKSIIAQLQPSEPAFLDARSRAQAEAVVKAAEAERQAAASMIAKAEADADHAAAELKRAETLAARNIASKSALEDAQLQSRTAAAGLEAARLILTAKEFELENARMLLADYGGARNPSQAISLKAPVSGRVFRVLQQSEAVVAAGTPILEIGNPGEIEVMAEFLSSDAVKIRPGASAAIVDWGGPKDLAALVRLVEPSGFTKISALGVEEQRVRIVLDIVAPREEWSQMGDGFRVYARITVWETDEAIQVPLSALFRNGQAWQTFVVRGGRAVLTDVSVGQVNDFDAQVLEGLQPGERVVLHPSDKIANGVAIAIRPS